MGLGKINSIFVQIFLCDIVLWLLNFFFKISYVFAFFWKNWIRLTLFGFNTLLVNKWKDLVYGESFYFLIVNFYYLILTLFIANIICMHYTCIFSVFFIFIVEILVNDIKTLPRIKNKSIMLFGIVFKENYF